MLAALEATARAASFSKPPRMPGKIVPSEAARLAKAIQQAVDSDYVVAQLMPGGSATAAAYVAAGEHALWEWNVASGAVLFTAEFLSGAPVEAAEPGAAAGHDCGGAVVVLQRGACHRAAEDGASSGQFVAESGSGVLRLTWTNNGGGLFGKAVALTHRLRALPLTPDELAA